MTAPEDLPRFMSPGAMMTAPKVTIAIPTLNRVDLLRESIKSAVDQDTRVSFEILVVDNASCNDNVEKVLDYLPAYGDANIRYYVNDTNIGMFGNWNRCLDLARGEWITILSDDDLLLPDFLSTMLAHLQQQCVASLVCQTGVLDQREQKPAGVSPFKTDLKLRVNRVLRFGYKSRIPLTLRRLFWGNIAGSALGAIFRTAEARALGGFDESAFPSADFDLHLKFAARSELHQVVDRLCLVRIQRNESMKPTTMHGFFVKDYKRRKAMVAAGQVPPAWARWIPYLLTYEIQAGARNWGVRIDPADVGRDLAIEPPRRAPALLMWLLRAVHGGV